MREETQRLQSLRERLEVARIDLFKALDKAGGNHAAPLVLEASRSFDRLLAAYMKRTSGRAR